jgi:hypothetical protein
MSLNIPFDDAIDSYHIQIFMKAVIANVPGGIHDTTEYSILEPLYDISVALAGEYENATLRSLVHSSEETRFFHLLPNYMASYSKRPYAFLHPRFLTYVMKSSSVCLLLAWLHTKGVQ